ncbi:transmembrane amino acid transporter protein-domain-containing protein [Leucosporidium creatinivorum]|uniref:Transmembrane amino acid transporter protein-domain-containing protein n=1 Tax=Leucosporidium creatinivorum TaxID=106004 RepID=A0A1Y2F2G7_9BASI|nr:transmembrane amino acid transporter protein-domain-containing protein [Leucosporidium creatinivorum]
MAARKIPIAGQRPAPSATAWQSSLDIVFSFSRSAGFFGENLPGPSFVDSQRYRRPGFPDDCDSSIAPSDRDRDASEDRDESIATTDEDWSGNELDDGVISWDNDGLPQREQLPSNAVVNHPRRSRRSRGSARPASSPAPSDPSYSIPSTQSSSHHLQPPSPAADERSPLISNRLSPTSTSISDASRPGRTPLLLHAATLADHTKQQATPERSFDRRLSIISSEVWQAAVEENRGRSTYGQTLFNTVNVLIGVGLLAEPLAFADAGWVLGTILLLFCALITNYTGKMLAKMMARDLSLLTYADVLIKAYGHNARTFIYAMFVLELGALSIALVVLFSDSMESLFPTVSSTMFKLLFFFIIVPTTFVPLRFLSITSLIGIISSITLLVVIIADGSLQKHSPGSLHQPMPTSVGPRWMRLPLSFGLLMSGFSGHAVIPSLLRDMKNPRQFSSMINVAYIIAFTVSMLFGALGYVMFGDFVSSEVTRDLIKTKGNPAWLNKIAVWMVALNPVVKYAIANAPLVQTFEVMIGLHPPPSLPPSPAMLDGSAIASEESSSSLSSISRAHQAQDPTYTPNSSSTIHQRRAEPFLKRYSYLITRPFLTAAAVFLAIIIPDFARVLSFLGSASAFIICCIGPIGAYLILGGKRARTMAGYKVLSPRMGGRGRPGAPEEELEVLKVEGFERALCWVLLVVSIGLAAVGTVWSFLPLEESR